MIRTVVCRYCGGSFEASRSDAVRCKACHAKKKDEHQRSPRGRELRARNHRRTREEAFAGYGGACSCCGESTYEFLALDHVNGGGREDRKRRNTWQIARDVIKRGFPDDFQILCHNCNLAKGWFGECPHKKKRTA